MAIPSGMAEISSQGETNQATVEVVTLPAPAEPAQIAPYIEAVLLGAGRPVGTARLIEALSAALTLAPESLTKDHITAAIEHLNEVYRRSGRSFAAEHVAGGYRLVTLPQYARALAAFHQDRAAGRLSPAAVETLAILAYRQPVTRAELEAIRGVACGEVLRTLMDKRLVTIKGRAEELGRPMLYGTTKEFLDQFGLATLEDLPPLGGERKASL